MSTRRSAASTVVAVVIPLVALAVLVAFVALGKSGDEKPEAGTEDLPDGFSRIPDDVFFERLNGTQRSATSWHFEQDKKVAGTTVTSVQSDNELDEDDVEDFHAKVTYCCDKEGKPVPFEVTALDGEFYAADLGSEKRWWHIDPTAGAESAGLITQLRALVSQETSPELQDAVDSITVIGPDTVAGVRTLHYRVVIKAPVPEPLPGTSPSPAPSTAASEAELDVWVDEENRPVRLVLTVGTGATRVETVTTYTKYGDDFDIEAPPAGETTEKAPAVIEPGSTP